MKTAMEILAFFDKFAKQKHVFATFAKDCCGGWLVEQDEHDASRKLSDEHTAA